MSVSQSCSLHGHSYTTRVKPVPFYGQTCTTIMVIMVISVPPLASTTIMSTLAWWWVVTAIISCTYLASRTYLSFLQNWRRFLKWRRVSFNRIAIKKWYPRIAIGNGFQDSYMNGYQRIATGKGYLRTATSKEYPRIATRRRKPQ